MSEHPRLATPGDILKSMAKETYSEKLRDPRWQKMRLDLFQRDKFCCQLCGDAGTELQIHHKGYIPGKDPWDYESFYLITLCKHRHAIVSELKINLFEIVPQVIKIKHPSFTLIHFIELRGWSIYKADPLELIDRFSHKTANKVVHALINFWNQNDM